MTTWSRVNPVFCRKWTKPFRLSTRPRLSSGFLTRSPRSQHPILGEPSPPTAMDRTMAGGRTIFWWAVQSKALDFMARRHPSVLPTARTHKTNGMSGRADCCPEHLQTSLPRLLGVGSVWRRANLRRSCPICEILENRLDGWTTRRILASCNCSQPCDAEARRHVLRQSRFLGRCKFERIPTRRGLSKMGSLCTGDSLGFELGLAFIVETLVQRTP